MKLRTYIIKRLLLLIPVLIGVSIFVFTLTRIGGNPAAAYINPDKMSDEAIRAVEERFHLHDPIYVQYWYWISGILQGDWGWSRVAAAPVTTAIATFFPATFELTLVSMGIAVLIGIWAGTLSAVKKDKPVDHVTRLIALSGVSLPIFWLALMLQYALSFKLDLLPMVGRTDEVLELTHPFTKYTGFYTIDTLLSGNWIMFVDVVSHLILPSVCLAFGSIAIITRMMRSSMLEVLDMDYVRTARSKGLSEKKVIKKHARKNAMIPTVTVIGLSFGGLLGGAVLTESIFAWPGLGTWSTQSIVMGDSWSIMGFVLIIAVIYVLANLVVDLLYAYLDPRVRLG